MAEEVNGSVVDAVTISNVKTIAEAGAFAMAQSFQDDVDQARRVNMMAEAHLGQMLNKSASTDPVYAVAVDKLFKGEADSGISSILAQLAAGQIGTKIAQSTPPETGVTTLLAQLIGLINWGQVSTKAAQTTPPVTPKPTK
jgi:flagellar motor switch protein FliG